MSVRSFHSVFMATAVAGAALGCYLVSLRVASERAALESVERQIVQTESEIRLLQTEIGTRARLAQLERWNVRVLALSAPTADQILGDKFQLARLIAPERKPAVEAPVILASVPAPSPGQPLDEVADVEPDAAPAVELMHQASLTVTPPKRDRAVPKPVETAPRTAAAKPARPAPSTEEKKAGEKAPRQASATLTKPVRTAKVDPLAPLPVEPSASKGSRTNR